VQQLAATAELAKVTGLHQEQVADLESKILT